MRLARILVPTDFSPSARAAADAAVDLAVPLGGTVTLLHVYSLPVFALPDGTMLPYNTRDIPAVLDAVDHNLGVEKARVARPGVTVETMRVEGPTGAVILESAGELNADLIVIGTHGRTGFRRALLGSVAEHVVRKAHCPVLVVHGQHEEARGETAT